eukprot:PhM_4_TR17526/c0_g1_i1/m.3797
MRSDTADLLSLDSKHVFFIDCKLAIADRVLSPSNDDAFTARHFANELSSVEHAVKVAVDNLRMYMEQEENQRLQMHQLSQHTIEAHHQEMGALLAGSKVEEGDEHQSQQQEQCAPSTAQMYRDPLSRAERLTLTSIDLSALANVAAIDDDFLAGCESLTSCANVTAIGTGFLADCESLTSLDLAP